MQKLFFLIVFCFFSSSVFGGSAPFPPYFFSANLGEYSDLIDGQTVRSYISFDSPSEDTKFIDSNVFTSESRESLMENTGMEDVPESVYVKFGFTVKSVNMRMMPSDVILHKGNPNFDMNQYTRVGASSPVAILHISKDSKYYYAQTEFMRGWIPADSVSFNTQKAFSDILHMPFLRVMKDGIAIGDVTYSIGDKIPIINKSFFGYNVRLPSGEEKYVRNDSALNFNNEEFSFGKMRSIAEGLLGNPYDWGGKSGFRDCSSFVRDLWLVFGLNLPRNTALQSAVGKEIIGKPSSKQEFYNALSNAKPFKTLIFFKGHVILYGGMQDEDFIVYHAVNRLVKDSGETQTIASVVRQELIKEQFSEIWKRVIKVTEIDDIL